MKKKGFIGTILLMAFAFAIYFKANQCFYEIGNGFFAGEALIPTIFAFVALIFFSRVRFSDSSTERMPLFIIGVIALVAMLIFNNNIDPVSLFNPDEQQYTCAIQETTFPEYYLKGKTLYSNTDFFSVNPIAVNKVARDFKVPEEQCEAYLQSFEKWRQEDWAGNVTFWISSAEWENNSVIYCFDCGDNKYMCPQSIYERCFDPGIIADYESVDQESSGEDDNHFPETIIKHYNNTKKLVIIESFIVTIYYLFGLLISILVLPKRKSLLACLVGFPIGCGLFSIIGYISLIMHLPYNWITFIVMAVIITFIIVFTDKKCISRIKSADYLLCSVSISVFVLLVIIVINRSVYLPGGDTYSCALIGMNIANDPGFFFTSIDWVASYGLFYSILNSQSYLLGGDYLFVINELMGTLAILLLIYFSYTLVKQKLIKYRALGEGIIALLSCILFLSADYHIHIFYFLVNMSVSVWFLISFGLIILGHDCNEFNEYWKLVLICFITIIQSRVEGGIYVAFFLTCLLINYIEDKQYLKLVLASLLWSLQLNIIQLIYNSNADNSMFWNPRRGIILIIGLSIPLILFAIRKIHLSITDTIFDNYHDLLTIATILGTTSLAIINRGIASQNIVIFTIHIIENKYFWIALMALVPIIAFSRDGKGYKISFFATLTICYICILFAMFLLKNDGQNGAAASLRIGMWDSGRRTLFQIMPTAAFLAIYQLIGWIKEQETSL